MSDEIQDWELVSLGEDLDAWVRKIDMQAPAWLAARAKEMLDSGSSQRDVLTMLEKVHEELKLALDPETGQVRTKLQIPIETWITQCVPESAPTLPLVRDVAASDSQTEKTA